jgi:hypothetical protein
MTFTMQTIKTLMESMIPMTKATMTMKMTAKTTMKTIKTKLLATLSGHESL